MRPLLIWIGGKVTTDKAPRSGGHALRIAIGIMILALVIAGGAGAVTITVDDSGGADYTRIQDAVNAASDGDTIMVAAGTYNENVVVNKSVSLIGAGAEVTIMNAYNPGEHVFNVIVNSVNISGFTITGAENNKAGIYLTGVQYSNVSNNTASNDGYGIKLSSSNNNILSGNRANLNYYIGIHLEYSSNNNITNNTANSNSVTGIQLAFSSNNNITGNVANSNNNDGIWIDASTNNIIKNNTAKENSRYDVFINGMSSVECNNIVENNVGSGDRQIKYFNYAVNLHDEILSELILCNADNSNIDNVTLEGSVIKKNNGLYAVGTNNSAFTNINSSNNWVGIDLEHSSNDILTGNIVNSNGGNGIHIYHSVNNNLTGNNASNNPFGIILPYSNNNNLKGNTINANTYYGIYLAYSINNNITGNIVSYNNYGIEIQSSNNNIIYNNFFNNRNDVYFTSSMNSNVWNITKAAGNNIIGGPYLGGNFWANPSGTGFSQTCIDANKNGICDSNYTLASGNVDYLPLAATPSGYGYISGNVVNNGTGIAIATVSTNTSVNTTTDASGFYSMLIPAGTYNLTAVSAPRFYPNSSTVVNVTSGITISQDIELTRKPTGNIIGNITKA